MIFFLFLSPKTKFAFVNFISVSLLISPPVNNSRGINLSPDENSHAQLEIGLVAMFIALSATNHGLNYGYCACNHNSEIPLSLGVGYANPDYVNPKKGRFYNPLLQKRVWLTSSDEQKPNKSKYIKFD